jgi:hypothetical protein
MKKTFLTIFCFSILLASCEVDEGLNIDKKNPTEVPGSGLFTNATRNFFDLMQSASVNFNVFRLYSQYWAQTTYPDESQYNQVTRGIGENMWITIYRDVLQDLKGARETLIENEADNLDNKLAIIEFMEVYSYAFLVETFGDVPYTEALDPENPSPVYDDAETIYADLLNRLDAAIAQMDMSGDGFEPEQDPVYNGDMTGWIKAANSLKLRMAMRLAEVDIAGVDSQTMAEDAASDMSMLILNNEFNFGIQYLGGAPNTNPVWVSLVQSGRTDFVGANTFVDVLQELDDPRLEEYFQPVGGEYIGGVYGSANSPSSFSLPGEQLFDPTLPGNVITASEVYFLLAEAAARGYSVGGTAEEFFEEGVVASVLEWNAASETEAEAYAARAWTETPGDELAKIAYQKWIALYNNGFEGWTVYRLFDDALPFNAPEDMTLADVPTRFLYPTSEATLNPSGYQAAASAIGGDTKTTNLFFDVE